MRTGLQWPSLLCHRHRSASQLWCHFVPLLSFWDGTQILIWGHLQPCASCHDLEPSVDCLILREMRRERIVSLQAMALGLFSSSSLTTSRPSMPPYATLLSAASIPLPTPPCCLQPLSSPSAARVPACERTDVYVFSDAYLGARWGLSLLQLPAQLILLAPFLYCETNKFSLFLFSPESSQSLWEDRSICISLGNTPIGGPC